MLLGIGAQKNPRTLKSEGAGYRFSQGFEGGIGSRAGPGIGERGAVGSGAKKNASRLRLAFHSRELVVGVIRAGLFGPGAWL